MNARLLWLTTRIDALSLRERVILFVSVILICLVVSDEIWIAPVQARVSAMAQQRQVQSANLLQLQEQLKAAGAVTDTAKSLRGEVAQLQSEIAAVNQDIERIPASSRDVTPLSQVLVHFLRPYEGLTLVRAQTLQAQASSLNLSQANPSKLSVRQGVELTVQGPYPELTRYVQSLERALPALRWGVMKLSTDKQSQVLTVQVFLVGVDP